MKIPSRLILVAALAWIAGAMHLRAEPAEPTDAEGQFQLARSLLSGTDGKKDPVRAFEWMKKAADQGHANALGGIGYFYARGVAVPEDDAAAVEWFRKGAEKGSATSQLNLGLAIANGRGVAPDPAEGLRWIDTAAAQGLPAAIYAQGETYHYGQFGRAIDQQKALALFKAAAGAGHLDAQCNFAVMLRDGIGGAKDEKTAVLWFRRAAEAGHAKSQSNLGHTLGVTSADRARRIEALMWVTLAANQREVTAIKTLDELDSSLAEDERAEVRQAVENWKPAPAAK